ncbi:arsenosugar biosynthesis radical SAM protein ArsS [Rhodoplanes sp. TEM]|uniref:Arsenosugar biosynthesis radical SAM protein ArsS n=1 Tax=Rhodoplanes tepidamans TaxID=200616 RepID=A0ABT5JI35_RHOTP|nr:MULTISPECIES: arsenosugar biosynthesis radical SAM (seleno)protein ArsS [Rhodoplanes]MDC7788959.1 arsenosugar biosynthesis radical SAM protein ArsS [Rhodoplanes tepidamans]MDC7987677.1 arsenosugar biosynthesis radical SAM protein ArsS [Rhodoplanes sp. TEM]MDQ0358653.1 radical SAM/Cys-rich protein [Rhodoplanes tepidamans]
MRDGSALLHTMAFPPIDRRGVATLQVNLGYRCNQSCVHCHVAAGPSRTEAMSDETIDLVLAVLERRDIATLDVTGGAPELHPQFRRLVRGARARGVGVMDRCNLTILEEPGHEDLADFLAGERVEIVASLPCYLEDNVDRQRGRGVFAASIAALRRLNALGYGRGDGLVLNLVFNPQGATLPPPQHGLERDYRRMLGDRHGIAFDRLFVLANMPIQRFGAVLARHGRLAPYLDLLRAAHRDDNLSTVMCRDLVSVDWRGFLYDCDFNQMLDLPLARRAGAAPPDGRAHLRDLLDDGFQNHPIRVAGHCYGCTAGQGSSCGGALEPTGAAVAAVAAE